MLSSRSWEPSQQRRKRCLESLTLLCLPVLGTASARAETRGGRWTHRVSEHIQKIQASSSTSRYLDGSRRRGASRGRRDQFESSVLEGSLRCIKVQAQGVNERPRRPPRVASTQGTDTKGLDQPSRGTSRCRQTTGCLDTRGASMRSCGGLHFGQTPAQG